MYLSRVPVNVMSRTFRRDYADVHEMHRTLMSVFPEAPVTQSARAYLGLLWRLDGDNRDQLLYVQSRERPDWHTLPGGYLSGRAQVKSLQPVFGAIESGRRFGFRLVANPTRSVLPPGGEPGKRGRGKRRFLHTPEEQIRWLIRQGESHGFTIPAGSDGRPDVAVAPMPPRVGYKTDDRAKPGKDDRLKITVSSVSFDGRLVVTDTAAFSDALEKGFGRAKAYGCGLLSLTPDRGGQP